MMNDWHNDSVQTGDDLMIYARQFNIIKITISDIQLGSQK